MLNDTSNLKTNTTGLQELLNTVNNLPVAGGSGDMEKSVYDTNGDGVVDNAERLGGVDASAYVKTDDLGSLATKSTVDKNDLSADIQASLNKADTALQSFTETDPTVPAWAKEDTKPSYTAGEVGAVPTSRTVNGKALSADITLSASDVGAIPDTIPIPDSLADLTSDATHRTVTDTEKATWNAKSNFSGSYNDLTNKPTIPDAANNGTLTIQKNGTTVTTFGANQSTNTTANITVPTKVSELSNDSNFASTTYVDNKVASIVDTAPEALNTLNELAAALGDDPNFATTVMTEIGKKADKTAIPDALADLAADATHRTVTDAEKATWNAKSNFDGNYNSLTNKPTIPTVNNATLTIQKNGTSVATFTANSSTNATANIEVPTKTSQLTNDSDFVTSSGTVAKATTADQLGGVAASSYAKKTDIPSVPVTSVAGKTGAVTLAKGDVGLGSVVNTGDSATPVSGGTTKFTTGGAYTELAKKVDKVSGKGLSTNDYTTTEKNKLSGIEEGANKTVVDSALSSSSTNPVENKVVNTALAEKMNTTNPTATGSFSLNRKEGSTVGSNSFAAGSNVEASGKYSHAEGSGTIALGLRSHAEGNGRTESVTLTGAANVKTYTFSSASSIRIGNIINYGDIYAEATSIDKTNKTVTLNKTLSADTPLSSAGAKIIYGIAVGLNSHSEGNSTTAGGTDSHAECYNTIASGDNSHAEGCSAIASGNTSHAEGSYTTSGGQYSHAEGSGTTAQSRSQHVQGEYNIVDISDSASLRGKYAHIVGNGASDTARSNAHTLDWNGTAWFAGDIKVGGTGQDDTAAKTVATLNDIPHVEGSGKILLARAIEHKKASQQVTLGLNDTLKLELDKTYTVVYDGVTYNTIPVLIEEGYIELGAMWDENTSAYDYSEYPFNIYYDSESLKTHIISSAAGEHTVTIKEGSIHKLDAAFLPDNVLIGASETVIYHETYKFPVSGGRKVNSSYPIQADKEYTVVFDGNTYKLTAVYDEDNDDYTIGTLNTNGFYLYGYPEENWTVNVKTAGFHTISISTTIASKMPSSLPAVTASDNGAFLRVVNGAWAAVQLPNVEEGEF